MVANERLMEARRESTGVRNAAASAKADRRTLRSGDVVKSSVNSGDAKDAWTCPRVLKASCCQLINELTQSVSGVLPCLSMSLDCVSAASLSAGCRAL